MSKKKTGWQTFEIKPEPGKWILVYAENRRGEYWIGTFEWKGSYLAERLGEIIPSRLPALLWRPYTPEPSEKTKALGREFTAAYGAPERREDGSGEKGIMRGDDPDWYEQTA